MDFLNKNIYLGGTLGFWTGVGKALEDLLDLFLVGGFNPFEKY